MRIRYERQRIAGRAQTLAIEPNYESSNQDIVDLFEQLCRKAGLSQRDHIPPLLLDQTGPGIVPHNFLHDAFSNQSAIHNRNYRPAAYAVPRRPVETPRPEMNRVFTLPPSPQPQYAVPYPPSSVASTPMSRTPTAASTVWSLGTPSTLITTPLPPMPESPHLGPQMHATSPQLLGEPARPLHRATFAPLNHPKLRVRLDTWSFLSLPTGRILQWKGENPAYTLKHQLPRHPHETFPYTKHSALLEKPRSLTFQTHHHITLKQHDKPVKNDKYEVEYRFTDDAFLRQFQSDLRDKELVGTFETSKIKCKNGNHINEHVKIWQSRDTDQTPSLSFFASGADDGFVECAIKWFKSPITQKQKDLEMTLELIKPPPGEGKRKGMFGRRSMSTHGKNGDGSPLDGLDNGMSPTDSKRGSVVTMSSTTSSNGDEFPTHCPQEIYDRVRQMVITFTKPADYQGFLAKYSSSQIPQSSSSRPRSGTSAETESVHSRTSSFASPTAELMDPYLTGSPASTADDMYRMPRLTSHGTVTTELPAAFPGRLFPGSNPDSIQARLEAQQLSSNRTQRSPHRPLTQSLHSRDRIDPYSQNYAELGIHDPLTAIGPRAGSIELRSDRDPVELHEDTRTQRVELDGDPATTSGASASEIGADERWDSSMEDTIVLDATGGIGGVEPLSIGGPRRGTGLLRQGSTDGGRAENGNDRYLAYRPP